MINESFESDLFPPAGWSLENGTTGFGFKQADVATGNPVHDGSKAAQHLDEDGFQDDWMISPIISIPADNFCKFSFWQSQDWLEWYLFQEVSVRIDGEDTWTNIYTPDFASSDGSSPQDSNLIYNGVWEKISLFPLILF